MLGKLEGMVCVLVVFAMGIVNTYVWYKTTLATNFFSNMVIMKTKSVFRSKTNAIYGMEYHLSQ